MKKRELLTLACLGLAAGLLLPVDLMAKTNLYGGDAIAAEGENMKNFIFGTVVPYVATGAAGYRTVTSMMSNDFHSMGIYGLVAVASLMMPKFISGVFASSMLIN